MTNPSSYIFGLAVMMPFLAGLAAIPASAEEAAGHLAAKIRPDHPRLFVNAEQWPAVRERALTVGRAHYDAIIARSKTTSRTYEWTEFPLPDPRPDSSVAVLDWGNQLMSLAFVYRMEPTPELLREIREKLQASVDYYHAAYADKKAVSWYGRSRVGWLTAFDWVFNDLPPDERRALGESMLAHVHDIFSVPGIVRRNMGGYASGYYGADNVALFAGIVFLNAGIDDEKALGFLNRGYETYQKLLAHRALSCGDDGGAASVTVTYSFAEYPWSEWSFLHAWKAATGEDVSADWPHIGWTCNYILWNWLPGDREYGYGDTPHQTNAFPTAHLYSHMSHIMHFYHKAHPELAALAHHVREKAGGGFLPAYFGIYPLLLTDLENAPAPLDPGLLPPARHFEKMGQVFMRSGPGEDDTYALFACGGITGNHRHYDANHFTIYRQGFLALDTGTRAGNPDNLQNYYAQTIAHNCILIKMPGEPPSPYWNGEVFQQAGGQNKQVGARVIAFETSPEFTYVAGDAAPQYSAEKCSQMVRQFVFVPPDHFVVFDRATSTQAEYAKTWLLHHANEPVVMGKTWYSDQDRGRIFCRTLLPEDAVLEKVGGPGKEFLVEGVNYPVDQGPSQYIKDRGDRIGAVQYKEVPELMGRWRMEVRPGSPRTDDVFLHLIRVGSQELSAMGPAEATLEGNTARITFESGNRAISLSLNATGPVGGHIRISRGDEVLIDGPLSREVANQRWLATPE